MILKLAAVLLFLLGLAHSVLGERYILVRLLRRDNLPKLFGGTAFTARTLRFAWHVTTVLWWGFSVLLWQAASDHITQAQVLQVIGYSSLAAAVLPLVITRGRHLSWMVLVIVGGIALYSASV